MLYWMKICANHLCDKDLGLKIHKQLSKFNSTNQTIQLENGQKSWTDITPRLSRWQINTSKDTQHHWPLGKCKLQPQ